MSTPEPVDPFAFAADMAAREDQDGDAWDEGMGELLDRGLPEAMGVARALFDTGHDRVLAASIAGNVAGADAQYAPEVVQRLVPLLDEDDDDLLTAVVLALGWVSDSRALLPAGAVARIVALARYPSEDVRYAVARALGQLGTWPEGAERVHLGPDVVDALLRLMADPDTDVRDWATFELSDSDADGDEVRAALRARLADEDVDVRIEAVRGLAFRGDESARAPLERLVADHVDDHEWGWSDARIEEAGEALGVPIPAWHDDEDDEDGHEGEGARDASSVGRP